MSTLEMILRALILAVITCLGIVLGTYFVPLFARLCFYGGVDVVRVGVPSVFGYITYHLAGSLRA